MKTLRLLVIVFLLLSSMTTLTGCSAYVNIPAGYIGMKLTPTGWDGIWLEAGQVNLGTQNSDGSGNRLVLLEVTSTTVYEEFSAVDDQAENKEDHRILTIDGVPVTVGVYVRMMVPEDNQIRTDILAQVTPKHFEGDPETVQRITIEAIYEKFAKSEVRGTIRTHFAAYENYGDIYTNFGTIPEKLGTSIDGIFRKNGVPLTLMAVSLSNVKPDEAVWTALNRQAAADAEAQAIKAIGTALRENPEYGDYMKWQYLERISKNSPGTTIIVDGSDKSSTSSGDYAAAQYLLQQLQKDTAASPTFVPTPTEPSK